MFDLDSLLERSLKIIRDHQAPTGAYLASPTFPPYRYSWFRDGAFIADAVSRVGDPSSAQRFHRWCTRVVTERAKLIEDLRRRAANGERIGIDEHLHTRYTVGGREADEPWWTFQLDGYGTWLWAVEAHTRRHCFDLDEFRSAIGVLVDYLATFWDHPCYDWWEEHADRRHVSTIASVVAGLEAALRTGVLDQRRAEAAGVAAAAARALVADEGVTDGHLTKWLGSHAVDASLAACVAPFELYPPGSPIATTTLAEIDRQLAPAGVHRYLDDVYYGGGQWILLAGFLGWAHVRTGNTDRATALLAWMVDQAGDEGHLPEQVSHSLLHPEHEQRWIERWGPSASPLLWSHAMLLTLSHELHSSQLPPPVTSEVSA